MEIIDFTKAREERLEKVDKTKKEPHARYTAMLEALEKEDLTATYCPESCSANGIQDGRAQSLLGQ